MKSPDFDGQKLKAVCPKTGENATWIGKYDLNFVLRWYCPHNNKVAGKYV